MLLKCSSEMPCVWTDFITGVLASGQRRGIRGNGHALVFPSFVRAVPLSPCQGVCWFSLPSSLLHCYLTWSPLKFHLFHEVLQPTGFSSVSFTVNNRKLGLIILGLVLLNVPSLPQKKKETLGVISHFLWILTGVGH